MGEITGLWNLGDGLGPSLGFLIYAEVLVPGLGGSMIFDLVMKLFEFELGIKLGTLVLLFW